mmetsp:Transcript_74585/g.228230  ORF Transcript_74585/g.228230 Transcript_74585/m.228230 type:complete len:228 (+) Transcript_74585:672-1355(+)
MQIVAETDLVSKTHIDPADVDDVGLALGRHAVPVRLLQTLGVLMAQAILHRLVDCRKKPRLTNELLELGLAHGLLHSVADHRKGHLDAPASEVGHNVVDHMTRCRIDGNHRRHLEHQILCGVDVLQISHICKQHVLDEGCVGEVHGRTDPADEHVRDERAAALLLHVAVDRRARDAPQDGELWADGFVNYDDQGQPHGDADAHEHAKEQCADKGNDPQNEVMPLDIP